jgi:hypothetical protein
VLLIVAFPVISLGTDHDVAAVWWLGFAALILAGVLPVLTRYMSHIKDRIRDMGFEFDERIS